MAKLFKNEGQVVASRFQMPDGEKKEKPHKNNSKR